MAPVRIGIRTVKDTQAVRVHRCRQLLHVQQSVCEPWLLGQGRNARRSQSASCAPACGNRAAGPKLDVLDCGFGFADQDLYWLRDYSPTRITGINVTPLQVERAHARVQEAGLASRIRLHFGSGTAMPFADSTLTGCLPSSPRFTSRPGRSSLPRPCVCCGRAAYSRRRTLSVATRRAWT